MILAALALMASVAVAGPACPSDGLPHVRTAVGAVVFEGERYAVRSPNEIEAFKAVLVSCGLEESIPDFLAWRRTNEISKSVLGWGLAWFWLGGGVVLSAVPVTVAVQSAQRVRFAAHARSIQPPAEPQRG